MPQLMDKDEQGQGQYYLQESQISFFIIPAASA